VGSGIVYAAIVGIWALALFPMWLRRHDADAGIRNVHSFRRAMDTLGNGIYKTEADQATPSVSVRRAGRRAGRVERIALARRRRAFIATLTTVPTTLAAVALSLLPITSLWIPAAAGLGYVMWVRFDVHRVEMHLRDLQAGRNATQPHLFASLASIRRAAAKRLIEEVPMLDTASTASWQPVVSSDSRSIPMPDHVVPTYVSAPAASETPRPIDMQGNGWDSQAMLEAANRQRQAELARIVSELRAADPVQVEFDDDATDEIQRVVGA